MQIENSNVQSLPKVCLLVIFCCVVFFSCQTEAEEYKTQTVCHKLIKKQVVNTPINQLGAFEETYIFMYEDYSIEEVNLKEYMKCDTGNRYCWSVSVLK